jgi:hypothetical protein
MPAGRPRTADAVNIYVFAHQFYWDFRRLAEGHSRPLFNKKRFAKLEERIMRFKCRIAEGHRYRIARLADEEIKTGRLDSSEVADWIHNAEESHVAMTRNWMLRRAAERCTKAVPVPGEPDVITDLLASETAEQVREICADAFSTAERQIEPGVTRNVTFPNWPIPVSSVLASNLSHHAHEFLAAKNDPRFPRSGTRPSTRLKQLWFISRALAGALYGVRTRTAINLVGSKLPDQIFEESRAGKSSRAKRRNKPHKKRSKVE